MGQPETQRPLGEKREGRPTSTEVTATSISTAIEDNPTLSHRDLLMADLDVWAEQLRARIAVQIVVDDEDHRRTFLYRSAGAAERCVQRAKDRGRTSHVTLVQLVPVGVVVGLGETR